MRISYNWLKELVHFDWSPEELADKLTMSGCEVESVEPLVDCLDGVVVGRIEEIEKHPSSDKLLVCWMNVGPEKLKLVCGSPNVKIGQLVPVALLGACLPGKPKLKSGKIKGIESTGMICSEKELGLGEETEKIMVLEDHLKVGTALMAALDLNDWVLDIDITANRPDCLSILGIAREISALCGNPIKRPEIDFIQSSEPAGNYMKIEIEDCSACPRYTARIIKNVRVAPSAFWLKRKLLAVGLRPINNVVDVANMVMMELGHPLHAFDYDLFSDKKIFVRMGKLNERFVTLDGTERKLDQNILLITDGKRPVAIAGIMGGMESEVTSHTKNVLIESAYFDPRVIRRGRMKLGISTESSYRFERGADPNITELAIDRAAQLMSQLAGGEVLQGRVDNYAKPISPLKITLRPKRANQLLDISLSSQEMNGILESLELKTQDRGEILEVEIPTFRPDLTRGIDLIEEIARVYGYDKIGLSSRSGGSLLNQISTEEKIQKRVKNLLIGRGFFEIITSNLVDPKLLEKINPQEKPLTIRNPLSEELSVLATSLACGMLAVIAHNKNHKQKDLKLFELGKVILPKAKEKLPEERHDLCLALSGRRKPMQWGENYKEEVDFFDLKGIIEEILQDMNVSNLKFVAHTREPFERECSLTLSIDNEVIGFCGQVARAILDDFGIKDKVFLAELNFDLLSKWSCFEKSFTPLLRFPSSRRDLAIIVDQEILSGDIEESIRAGGKDLVEELVLFDLYQGKQVPKGKKSLAYSISYRSSQKTLTDEEVEKAHQNIVSRLKKQFGAELRK